VNTAVKIGPQTVKDYAQRLGIKSRLYAYPSIALGTSEVSPLEMANAYGVFAANGLRAEPLMVRLIKDRLGKVIEDNSPVLHRVSIKPQTVAAMNGLFQAVVLGGTGSRARVVPTAHGKTGTTENYADAWFVGYTLQPPLATAVWAGNRDNKPMRRGYGGTICVPIWTRFMAEAVKVAPKTKLKPEQHLAAGDLGARQRDERSDASQNARPRTRRRPSRDSDARADTREAVATAAVTSTSANPGSMIRVRVCEETWELATRRCSHARWLEYTSGSQPRRWCGLHAARRTRRQVRRPTARSNDQTTRRAASPSRETTSAPANQAPPAAPAAVAAPEAAPDNDD
jgi:membrane peptidoglycan carboxypeptidase